MDKNTKIYAMDLPEGQYKTILENFACTDCNLVPHYELGPVTNGGFNITFATTGWERIDDRVKCPLCTRKIKIERLKNITNNIK